MLEAGTGPHAPNLPIELRAFADQMRRQFMEAKVVHEDWTLHWGPPGDGQLGLDEVRLEGFVDFKYDSGWAPLACGLIAADRALDVNLANNVWASGCWAAGGVTQIEGWQKKLLLANDWKATHFFVLRTNLPDVLPWAEKNLRRRKMEIGALKITDDPVKRSRIF